MAHIIVDDIVDLTRLPNKRNDRADRALPKKPYGQMYNRTHLRPADVATWFLAQGQQI